MRIAQEKGFLDFKAQDLRKWTHDKHRTTDDEPYGGGQGLVMKCEPIFEATDELFSSAFRKQGKPIRAHLTSRNTYDCSSYSSAIHSLVVRKKYQTNHDKRAN